MAKKVLVGLSGGIDSAYCAEKLIEEGFDVTGIYFAFCNDFDAAGAEKAAEKLGIGFVKKDLRKEFGENVIKPFLSEYENGRTPNPCVICNPLMKFYYLEKFADEMKIDYIATGHYAKISVNNKNAELFSAKDKNKDQSYFLWRLSQKTLQRTLFPLQDTIKTEMKEKSKSSEKESMDICFIPDGDTGKFVSENTSAEKCGEIVSKDGTLLGHHKGIVNYTVGQRRGLGVAVGKRAYVIDIDKDENKVVLGDEEDMKIRGIYIENLNFISGKAEDLSKLELSYKSRSRMKKERCRAELSGTGAYIFGEEKMRRISPGQSVVIYSGERLVFGGTAEKNIY